MKIYTGCIPCFARQAVEAAEMSTEDTELRQLIIRKALHGMAELPFDRTPPHAGMIIHRIVKNLLGNIDPYQALKALYNRKALSLYTEMKAIVARAENPIEKAARLAIAGNDIDFGIRSNSDHVDLHGVIDEALRRPLVIDHTARFTESLGQARRILYVADNAGEVVFDRVLVEEIQDFGERVVFVVKGEPVLNDATMRDAEEAGLTGIVRVIDNGSDAPGTIIETCSDSFLKELNHADLIISKGQGNYETLSDEPRNVFFLLKAKCPVIARDLGVQVGDLVLESLAVKREILRTEPEPVR
jgi:uncharacterized protein with ATP-grasp and redox domains